MQRIKGLMVIALALALAGPALAQTGPGGGMGRGMGPALYNPQTVATVKGQVEKLEEVSMGPNMAFREIILKTDQGSLMVDLAPAWFLNEKKVVVQAGDTVSATGSKTTLDNQPGLIAREVTVKGTTVKLRDEQGVPVWQGAGRGGGMGQGMKSGGGMGQGPPPR